MVYFKGGTNDKQELDTCILAKVITHFFGIWFSESIKILVSFFDLSSMLYLRPIHLSLTCLLHLIHLVFFDPDFPPLSHITIPTGNISNFFIDCFANLIIKSLHHILNSIFTDKNNCLISLSNTILVLFWRKKVQSYHKKEFLNEIYLFGYVKYIFLSICNQHFLLLASSFYLVDVLFAELQLKIDLLWEYQVYSSTLTSVIHSHLEWFVNNV